MMRAWGGSDDPDRFPNSLDADTQVRVKFRDGSISHDEYTGYAGVYIWQHRDQDGDIVAFEPLDGWWPARGEEPAISPYMPVRVRYRNGSESPVVTPMKDILWGRYGVTGESEFDIVAYKEEPDWDCRGYVPGEPSKEHIKNALSTQEMTDAVFTLSTREARLDGLHLPTNPKERKATPLYSGVMAYFPDALVELAQLSQKGNDQHNPGQPLHWDRSKSTDHADCILRHQLDVGQRDADGARHATKVAWRALAQLQVEIERERK